VLPDMDDTPSGKLTFNAINTEPFWAVAASFLFVELFDSFSTLLGTMTRAGLMKDPKHGMDLVNKAMAVDGFGLTIGALIGSNSITCYIESNTGIEAGARTGFASIVTGSLFLLSLLFVAPFVLIIPDAATCCALVVVGVLSMEQIKEIKWEDWNIAFSSFLIVAVTPFTYSISNGLSAGFIFYAFLQLVRAGWQAMCKRLNRPTWALPEELDSSVPHPLFLVVVILMIIRFAFLAA
jgi:AGZA family xanthine/uracil permease-like MFS transporter